MDIPLCAFMGLMYTWQQHTHTHMHTHRRADRQHILAYGEALETTNVTLALSLGALF